MILPLVILGEPTALFFFHAASKYSFAFGSLLAGFFHRGRWRGINLFIVAAAASVFSVGEIR
jgi:hypothetical protein